jgi:signal transduction histidine kinase
MSTRKKILFMFSFTLFLFLFSIITNLYFSKQRHEKIQSNEIESKEYSVEGALQQSGDYLDKFANDNSIWDGLVRFVQKYDQKWVDDNINTLLHSSQIKYIWIYNEKCEPVHRLSSVGFPIIQHPISINGSTLDLLSAFPKNKRVTHYYIKNDTNIIDIAGATIHYSNDYERKQSPKGYFFIGKIVDKSMINQLSIITNSKVVLHKDTLSKLTPQKFQMLICKSLKDWTDTPVANLSFISEDKIGRAEEEYSLISIVSYIGFIVLVILFAYWMINKLITNPLKKIVDSLNSENDTPIKDLAERNDEFGQIAQLIKSSYEQKEQIEAQYDQIADQNTQLEDLNATKDKFFSIIAHDLKNPFGVILATTEFIANPNYQLTREEIVDFSKDINHTAKMLFNLLENLLTWARTQRGTIQFDPMVLDIKDIAETTKFVLDSQADAKEIHINIEITDNLQCVGDRNMVLTIIRNLCSNAIKFTKNGGEIKITGRELNEEMIEIAVSDNGVGISAENLNKLFRIDVNLTTDGTSQEKGTGLGLILCKEFVEKHGGTIGVKSEINKGTEFSFTLPKKELKKYNLVSQTK